MSIEKTQTRLVVIGAGPGGYAAAFRAADLGLETTLIDMEDNPGGVCLYRGCIPSKALLHIAKLVTEAQEAKNWGVEFAVPKINIEKMQGWKEGVVKKLTSGLGQLVKQRKIRYLKGQASFLNSSCLRLVKANGGEEHLTFENAIIATGSRPATNPAWPLHSPDLMNSTGALSLEKVPQTLLVIGGGYIGLELGSVYAALGSKVTVVEMTDGFLPGADRDLVSPLAKRLSKMFTSVRFKTRVDSITEVDGGLKVGFSGPEGAAEEVFEKVLVSVGRKPNSSGLNLQDTQVQIDEKGFIKVDLQRRTHDPKIFAIGDVAGEPMLAHKAAHEGITAVEAILGHAAAFEPYAIPAVVFTDPEIAWCGVTETDVEKKGLAVEVAKFPWAASGRAMTLDRTEGLTKLILEPGTGRVLGMGIVGPGAGELISEGVLAVEMGATAKDVAMSIHPHPTLSETVMESAEVFYGQSVHLFRPRKK